MDLRVGELAGRVVLVIECDSHVHDDLRLMETVRQALRRTRRAGADAASG
jgi:hypothetical protein